MIRLMIFLLIRFFIAAVVIYFILAFLRGIIKVLKRPPSSTSRFAQSETPSKPKEDYKDVQDAKFTELSDENKESTKESNV